MKTNFLLLILPVLFLSNACMNQQEKSAAIPETDSLMAPWMEAWHAGDTGQIAACLTPDAVVILPDTMMTGINLLRKAWIGPVAKSLRNLAIVNKNEEKSGEIACISGSYTNDWVQNDSVVGHAKGYYTFLFKKQADNRWKISVVNLN